MKAVYYNHECPCDFHDRERKSVDKRRGEVIVEIEDIDGNKFERRIEAEGSDISFRAPNDKAFKDKDEEYSAGKYGRFFSTYDHGAWREIWYLSKIKSITIKDPLPPVPCEETYQKIKKQIFGDS